MACSVSLKKIHAPWKLSDLNTSIRCQKWKFSEKFVMVWLHRRPALQLWSAHLCLCAECGSLGDCVTCMSCRTWFRFQRLSLVLCMYSFTKAQLVCSVPQLLWWICWDHKNTCTSWEKRTVSCKVFENFECDTQSEFCRNGSAVRRTVLSQTEKPQRSVSFESGNSLWGSCEQVKQQNNLL